MVDRRRAEQLIGDSGVHDAGGAIPIPQPQPRLLRRPQLTRAIHTFINPLELRPKRLRPRAQGTTLGVHVVMTRRSISALGDCILPKSVCLVSISISSLTDLLSHPNVTTPLRLKILQLCVFFFLRPFAMTSLTLDPTNPLAASTRVPSNVLSDENVSRTPSCPNTDTSDAPDRRGQFPASYERKMGDTEVSYYLQGRATGVNDMFASIT